MSCKCGSTRIVRLGGKCSDCCSGSVRHLNIDYDGYVPRIEGIGGGDYFDMRFCADCGQLQNFKTLTDDELNEAFGIEPAEDE